MTPAIQFDQILNECDIFSQDKLYNIDRVVLDSPTWNVFLSKLNYECFVDGYVSEGTAPRVEYTDRCTINKYVHTGSLPSGFYDVELIPKTRSNPVMSLTHLARITNKEHTLDFRIADHSGHILTNIQQYHQFFKQFVSRMDLLSQTAFVGWLKYLVSGYGHHLWHPQLWKMGIDFHRPIIPNYHKIKMANVFVVGHVDNVHNGDLDIDQCHRFDPSVHEYEKWKNSNYKPGYTFDCVAVGSESSYDFDPITYKTIAANTGGSSARLSELIRQYGTPSHIFIDTDGAEMDVLNSMDVCNSIMIVTLDHLIGDIITIPTKLKELCPEGTQFFLRVASEIPFIVCIPPNMVAQS